MKKDIDIKFEDIYNPMVEPIDNQNENPNKKILTGKKSDEINSSDIILSEPFCCDNLCDCLFSICCCFFLFE